jgi:hypothetical protein
MCVREFNYLLSLNEETFPSTTSSMNQINYHEEPSALYQREKFFNHKIYIGARLTSPGDK